MCDEEMMEHKDLFNLFAQITRNNLTDLVRKDIIELLEV